MVYVLALGAALANALTSVLQRMGVEDAPADSTLKLSLITHAIRRGVWLLGFALMVCSFLLQAVALHNGRLSVVQPILTTELLFLVLILGTWFRFQVGLREWLFAIAAAAGLAGFLVFADPVGGTRVPGTKDWLITGGCVLFIITIAIVLALRGPRWWRAAMFGTAGATAFAFTAALTKQVTDYVTNDWISVLWHWETYALIVFGIGAVFLAQNAFHAGPIAASQSTLVLVDPLASIVIGIVLFGDDLRTSEPYGALEALSLLIMFVGAAALAHSPLVSGMKGGDDAYDELLSVRSRSKRLAAAIDDGGVHDNNTYPPLSPS